MDFPEELKAKILECPPEVIAYIVHLHERIDQLESRVKELESRLNLNSRNSGKPPSSDGYAKKNRNKSDSRKKYPGGQPGHKGTTLRQSPHPDHIEYHKPHECSKCGHSLVSGKILGIEKRQVFDLPPPPTIEITEHQSFTICCPHCGLKTSGDFPEDVTHPVQYGSRVKSYLTYLSHHQLIPYERVTEICSDLFGFSVSPGTIVNLTHNLAKKLQSFKDDIVNILQNEPVIHNDETGVRVEGKLHWLHVTCTPNLTHYSLQRKRGKEGMDNIGILPEFHGISVHDFWGPYLSYSCEHSFCCAHIIRELIRVEEETSQKWPYDLIELLLGAKENKEIFHGVGVPIPPIIRTSLMGSYDELTQIGLDENPPSVVDEVKRGRKKKGFVRNLLERLKEWKESVLKFINDPLVPFDNNQAERDIRMMKVKMKISGGFRSFDTASAIGLIRSYISTVRKNGINVIEGIVSAFHNFPWSPNRTKDISGESLLSQNLALA